ncbi:CRISPR-associated helicase Cas3' [Siphonobacter sp. SORGH_AS_1065]|uniref:CRISPR-associated helicase Cas3' n=1 Tax=Siphonobacter sp. SORGH_AS_1065 TaxID=3041795 RepID=UPI002783F429|nr:CRISPR-associated helicase Cas3' [Siphonobacter sp. SORGH_AS_1065]MDQ1086159.1 CRISPR-associated endonuclease/helicase Cas3 [Siphonobacter sp. SORGH_AS_1065]
MLYSHPGVPLIDHLRKVAVSCRQLLKDRITGFGLPDGLLSDLGYLAGVTHDVAKGTRYFQHYLLSPNHEVIGPKEHALLSSLLTKMVVEQYLTRFDLDDTDRQLLPYLVFTAIKRHHGNLKDFTKELFLEEKADILSEQIEVFDEPAIQDILNKLLEVVDFQFDWSRFKTYVQEKTYLDEYANFSFDFFDLGDYKDLPTETKNRYFYWHQLFYGTLLLSDKSDVILKGLEAPLATQPALKSLASFRQKHGFDRPKTSLDELKNQAYHDTLRELDTVFRTDQHLYSITLPTGLGKTLTSLATGIAIQQKLGLLAGRLIITIPFTSIIDQNYAVFQEVFDNPPSNVLLKHHHLAEPAYKVENDTFDQDKSQFLIETWQSSIVVTTFVQLLESLFSNDKTKLLKLPNLANSVIILDEVQQVKYELWPLIRQAFMTLGKRYNCYFILMSATQPLIFKPEEEIKELVPNYRAYFKSPHFNRTKLINRTEKEVSFAEFQQDVITYCRNHSNKNVLVILNTKQATLDCFKAIANSLDEETADVYYLTTLITPYERKRIIDRIKTYKGSKQQVIISTALIEAGVDVSVHTVFRVLAPLDSIIQAAGRANRYNEKGVISEVFLYAITEHRRASGMVYGGDLLVKTGNVLKGVSEIDEHGYLFLIEAYFNEVRKQADVLISPELTALQALDFEQVGAFEFVEERNTESVYVQLNEEAKQLWEQYVAISERKDLKPYERKREFSLIKARFYDYVVNVPVPFGLKSIVFDSEKDHFFYISHLTNPSRCYQYAGEDYRSNTGYTAIYQPLTVSH